MKPLRKELFQCLEEILNCFAREEDENGYYSLMLDRTIPLDDALDKAQGYLEREKE